MSFYQLLPPPHEQDTHAFWEGGFSESECYRIRTLGDSMALQQATVGNNTLDPTTRRSKTSWFALNNDTQWIYDKLGFVARQLNGQFFGFDISGFSEDLQYTIYESTDQGHYDYHMDSGYDRNRPPRKLSLSLQLSSPDEYEGGDLELLTGREPIVAKKELGVVYAFPSYILHRVTPVTKGTRRSLVVWLCGNRFR